ncbi:hypothetical protein AB0L63_00725 [Nocardia sp. NPDC051990]
MLVITGAPGMVSAFEVLRISRAARICGVLLVGQTWRNGRPGEIG